MPVWELCVQEELLKDRLVETAVSDLEALGGWQGLSFLRASKPSGRRNSIIVELRHGLPAETVEISSSMDKGFKHVVMGAADTVAAAHGLYWAWDRLKTCGDIPLVKMVRRPTFKYRFTYISLGSPTQGSLEQALASLRQAARVGVNHVLVYRTENYVPWDGRHGEEAERCRELLREFIEAAHSLHVKVLVYGDEFIYLDSWLEKFGGKPCVSSPGFWKALEEKYRALLRELPELDGVAVRTGEVIPHGGFKAFDVMHSRCPGENYSLEYKYRKFLDTIYGVVVEEFGKIYYHRTWVTNDWEQHSVPEILQRILDGFPRKNFILSIKLTEADQWEYQPLNPTIGAVKHTTVVECETGRAHQWGGPVMDFAAEFIQAGLQYALMRGARGVSAALPSWSASPRQPGYDALPYTVWRLAWNPGEDLEKIVTEWAAQYFGAAAPVVAEVLLKTDDAVRDSYYVAPYAVRVWNPLGHIYGSMFICKGNPFFDNGRGHDEFLKTIYLHCKPCLDRVWELMDRGVATYDEMIEKYLAVKHLVPRKEYRDGFEEVLRHARAVLNLNRLYVKAFTAYFEYREKRSPYWRGRLARLLSELGYAASEYEEKWGLYRLYGIKEFLKLARRALIDPDGLEQLLATSPTTGEVEELVRQHMDKEEKLASRPDAKMILRWEGVVDGRDILHVKGETIQIEHLLAEPIHDVKYVFYEPVAAAPARYAVKRIRCRGAALVLENPSSDNGYTLKIYLDDTAPGPDRYVLEIYRISEGGEGG